MQNKVYEKVLFYHIDEFKVFYRAFQAYILLKSLNRKVKVIQKIGLLALPGCLSSYLLFIKKF
jgi:hypothetical protein